MKRTVIRDPIYNQVVKILKEMINGGEFQPGERFLTERRISEEYDISRNTSNKVISSLVSEGILEIRKGIGTFVRPAIFDFDLSTHYGFTQKALKAGKNPRTQVLRFQLLDSSQIELEVVEKLRLNQGESAYYVERLRFLEELPVIIDRRFLVRKYLPDLEEQDLAGSLFRLLSEKFGLQVCRASETIRAVSIGGKDARLMGVPEGESCLLILSTGFIQNDAPLWTEKTLYRGDAYEFRNRIGPVEDEVASSGFYYRKSTEKPLQA